MRSARDPVGIAAGLLCLALLAIPSAGAAQAQRVEVVGSAPETNGSRQGALEDALRQAVSQVADQLVGSGGGPVEADWLEALGGSAGDYVLRYRVLEDLGPATAGPGGRPAAAHRLRVEAQVDGDRVATALRTAGFPVANASQGYVEAFRLVVLDPPSYLAVRALREQLQELGVRRSVPERIRADRVDLRVESATPPEDLLDRLLASPPPGVGVEPVRRTSDGLELRLIAAPASMPELLPAAD